MMSWSMFVYMHIYCVVACHETCDSCTADNTAAKCLTCKTTTDTLVKAAPVNAFGTCTG